MLWAVENLSDEVLGGLDVFTFGSGTSTITATGGQKLRELPYPFGHIELTENGGSADTASLVVRFRDLAYREPMGLPHKPAELWAGLVQAGTIAITMTAEALPAAPPGGLVDPEERFLKAV